MEIIETDFEGVVEIRLQPHLDERGFFMRTYDYNEFEKFGINRNWVQENHSESKRKGIIRGLHFQFPPYTETKLIRCIRGEILDVFVDLRKASPSFGEWGSISISEEKKNMVLIPKGFAHGFCTLTEISDVVYKVDNYYSPNNESGIKWDDTYLDIFWPIKAPLVSEKDKNNMSFNDFRTKYNSLEV